MFSFFKQSTKAPLPATVNGIIIDVNPGETLLNAALRANIDFPHSCRVGGCAACKCKLQRGRVRELTDNSYILSDKELEQGYILACQATPITPITVAVGLPGERPHQTIEGKIIAQEPLTHDITTSSRLACNRAWSTSCWYCPTPIDLGSIFTSSASGSISRRPMETAPRTVTS